MTSQDVIKSAILDPPATILDFTIFLKVGNKRELMTNYANMILECRNAVAIAMSNDLERQLTCQTQGEGRKNEQLRKV